MFHPNAPLTAEGRRRLAVLIVEQGWTIRRAAERFQVSPAAASKWGQTLSGWYCVDGPWLTAAPFAPPTAGSTRASDYRAAVYPPVGPAPDRLPLGYPTLHRRPGTAPVSDAAVSLPRSGHWPAGAKAQTHPV